MEDQEFKDPGKKAFFQTLPGIFTGIAAIITALGGFLVILSKTGCMHEKPATKEEQTEEQKKVSLPPADSDTVILKKKNNDEDKPVAGTDGKLNISFSPAEVKNFSRNVVFKIKEAVLQPSGQGIIFNIKIKCLNESNTAYYFYPQYIRVKSGEDKYSPDESSPSLDRQLISSQGFNNIEYNFKLPKGIAEFQVLLFDDYSSSDPVTFKVNQ